MLLEMFGPSCSGKTSAKSMLIEKLQSRSLQPREPRLIHRKLAELFPSEVCINALEDIYALPFLLSGYYPDKAFWSFCAAQIQTTSTGHISKLLLRRALYKKILLSSRRIPPAEENTIHLLDEGLYNFAQSIFSRMVDFDSNELIEYLDRIPLKSTPVYVTAPLEILLERYASRADPISRKWSLEEYSAHLGRAHRTMEETYQHLRRTGIPVYRIDNNASPRELGFACETISREIRERWN